MPDKDCIITIIRNFLLKNWEGNSKYNVETSVDIMLRNQHDDEREIIYARKSFIYTFKNNVKYGAMT